MGLYLTPMRYTQKRFYSWSENLAYLVGLIASDGCLQKDGRHIDITSTDLEILQNVLVALNRNIKIGTKVNKSKKPAFHVQFSDIGLYDFLLSISLTPQKSHTINKLSIPDAYYPDFLRGVVDGDGSFYGYSDKRWKSSDMYYLGIYSASTDFLKFIRYKNTKLFRVSEVNIKPSTRAHVLSYAKSDTRTIFNKIYHSDSCLKLTRKYNKISNFISSDRNGTICEHAQVA